MNEEYFEYLDELEESLHKGMKIVQKAKQKVGQMGFRDNGGGYGNRFNGPMGGHNPMMGGYPPMMGPMMGNPMQGGFPGQMGFREGEMMERSRDAIGRYTRG